MGHVMFYLAVIAACLLWSAAFVAAAARTERPWLRRLLAAVAVIIPPLALGPWVGLTGVLAFGAKLTTNWFAPTLFAFVSAIVGGLWIRTAGLAPAVSGRPFAATWPVVGLGAMFVMAKAMAFGTLLFIDNAVAAEGRALRVEAAQLMQANLPLATAPDGDAAPLYLRAFEAITADPSFGGEDSPVSQPVTADGDAAAALRDVVRIHRVGIHAAGEPILICGLVGQAIDTLALHTLAGVLPRLEQQDLPLLDQPAVSDFLATPLSYQRHFLGEEAFGLATFGDLADGGHGMSTLALLNALGDPSGSPAREWFLAEPVSFLYRCFLLPADMAGYRAHMERHQRFIARSVTGRSPSEFAIQVGEVADESSLRRVGLITSAMAPALANALQSEMKGRALHRAAEVLVAATRARLAGGTLPDTVEALVPGRLPVVPRDPFADGKPLIARRVGGIWSVYSVGPDGEDDGGPPAAGVQPPEGNDDVGLRLQVSAGTASDAP